MDVLTPRSLEEAQIHERNAAEIQRILAGTAAVENSDILNDLYARLAQEQNAAAKAEYAKLKAVVDAKK